MNDSDFDQFSYKWSSTMTIYNKFVTDIQLDVTFQALQSYSLMQISEAIRLHLSDPTYGSWPPKPADIVRFIRGAADGNACQAWAKVERAIRCVGPYPDVTFDDELVHAAIESLGGWIALCGVSDKELPFKRNAFISLYMSYFNASAKVKFCGILLGIESSQSSACGKSPISNDVVLIGNKKLAKIVMAHSNKKSDSFTRINKISQSLSGKMKLLRNK